jgi:hypothetical protein
MEGHRFDRLAVSFARGSSRRAFLAAAVGAIGAGIAGRGSARAACSSAADCDPGMVCDNGFCLYPACLPPGSGCGSHDDCCDDHLCMSGVCSAPARCGLEGEACGASACCPGMSCASGICAIDAPPPPEPTGGDTSGGESGGSTGRTTGGVVVAQLPSTGVAERVDRQGAWGIALASLATVAGLLGVRRQTAIDEDQIPGDRSDDRF